MKQYKYSKITFILLLCGFLFHFTSCDMEDTNIQEENTKPVGEKTIVNFTVGEVDFGDEEVVARKTSPNPSKGGKQIAPIGGVRSGYEETVVVPITDNTYICATLNEEETPVHLRAKVSLSPGTKVRVVAYVLLSGDTIYIDHHDYEIISGNLLDPITTHMTVSAGLTYRFVAYSFNDATTMPAFAEITPPIPSSFTDVLWGDTVATIPYYSAYNLHITMKHKQSVVAVKAMADFGSTNTLNSVDAAIYCYNNPILNVKTGILSASGNLALKPFSWSITDPLLPAQSSNMMYVFTGEDNTTRLQINQIKINYLTFDDPVEIIYHKLLEAGKTYQLLVHFMWARGGSADRITWDNNNGQYAITRDPTDAGLYFKFGSVVGIFSNAGSILALPGRTINNDSIFTGARDVAWHPFLSNIATWGGVPAYSNSDYPQMVTPKDNYHTIANVKAGKGDPCRLVGMDLNKIKNSNPGSLSYSDIDNGRWRLPSLQENIWFTNNAIPNSTLHFWDLAGGSYPSPFGPYVAGGEFPQRGSAILSEESRKAKFLPAAGCRSASTGNVISATQGIMGYFWSNESILEGLTFTPNGNVFVIAPVGVVLYPLAPPNDIPIHENINWGFNIRCIRQTLDIEVGVNPWENGGDVNVNKVM